MACPVELIEWQRLNIESLRKESYADSKIRNVTVIAYYFQSEKEFDYSFWRTEFSLLKTFQTQGIMPAVLVTNLKTDALMSFCARFHIEVQIAENLVPGKIKTLALDMVENLHARFATDYALIVQDDGFPMRPGLEEFVGKWDYVGAPWVRHVTYYDIYPADYGVGNGGFSLRSKRLCKTVSSYYVKYFRWMPYWWYLMGDDTFYCKTLRFWFPSFRKRFQWASKDEASRFSVECDVGYNLKSVRPLGFHGKEGWKNWRSCDFNN
ncbi:MAG: hypothetical protein IJG84_21645 [Kiritimatiellae bacterium]|nr:hypothetical protein [Kiritimatiellia bacterium]